jgi:hypothetical protein
MKSKAKLIPLSPPKQAHCNLNSNIMKIKPVGEKAQYSTNISNDIIE